MSLTDMLFIGFYNFSKKIKASTPIFASVNYFALTIIVWAFLILAIDKKYFDPNLFSKSLSAIKFYYVLIHLSILYFIYKFFNSLRVKKIIIQFENESLFIKKYSIFFSIVMLLAPLIAIAFLLKK
jgi:hypothetical protein